MCWFGTNTDIQDRIEIERALKDADARKDQFLATLAHELRNPLSPLSNALQLWPYVVHNPAELEHLREVISRQVRQLVRLIDDLLDVSRITQGKINLHLRAINVGHLIAGAVEAVQPMIDAAGHALHVRVADEPLCVRGHSARLVQVFSNILNNAAKYTGRGGSIWVEASCRDGQAVVRIRDNGPGIPADRLKDIFDAFHQVDRTLHRSHGGLGIGLTLARQLIELHGGTVEARSDGVDRGSEFVVALPAISPAIVTADQLDIAPVPTQAEPLLCHRIAVVDDLRESATTLASLLRSLGQDAVAFDDPEAAFDWIVEHRPDIAILDIAMPRLDGHQLARRLRQCSDLHDLVLVALTGHGQPEDRRRAMDAGFNFHLTKPPDLRSFEDLLRDLPAATAGA